MIRSLAALPLLAALAACTSTAAPAAPSSHPPSMSTASAAAHPAKPSTPMLAASWPTPDRTLTPGAIVPGCTYPVTAARAVTQAEKALIRAEYHYTGPTDLAHVEIDHRVPHSLCGSDAPANLWVEVYDGVKRSLYVSNRKDAAEIRIASLVRRHLMTLATAQRLFLGDWRVAWCIYVHVAGDGVTC